MVKHGYSPIQGDLSLVELTGRARAATIKLRHGPVGALLVFSPPVPITTLPLDPGWELNGRPRGNEPVRQGLVARRPVFPHLECSGLSEGLGWLGVGIDRTKRKASDPWRFMSTYILRVRT